jgi:flagellar hook-associated protein 3 FlgL
VERISTFLFHQRATQEMLSNQARLSRTQNELATGRRILSPSDDPSGATKSLDLKRYLASNEQFGRNIGTARARLEQQESALASATDLLQRARELAVQGNTATTGPAARAGLAEEVDQLVSQLLALANTRDSNGEYLFGGLARSAVAFTDDGGGTFVYHGDTTQRRVQVSEDRQVADAETGQDVFMDVGGAGGPSVFRIAYDLAAGLRSGVDLSPSLDGLDRALDQVLGTRARGGARLSSLDDVQSINADMAVTLEAQLSDIQDLDYAEAVARMNRQLTALQASQQSYAKMSQLSLFNYL